MCKFKKLTISFTFSAAFLFCLLSNTLFSAEWIAPGSPANWNDNANWTTNPAPFPNATDATADITNLAAATNPTLNLNVPITVGTINVDMDGNTTIDPNGGNLIFDVATGNAAVNHLNNRGDFLFTISAPITLNDSLDVNVVSTSGSTFSGNIDGTGGVTIQGGGNVTFDGNNSYSGGTIITAGSTFTLGSDTAAGNDPTHTISVSDGASLSILSGVRPANNITLNGTSTIDTTGTNTLSGTISGVGATLQKTGLGFLTLSNGSNDYSGGTNIVQGTLSVIQDANLGQGNLIFNGGTLNAVVGFSSSKTISLTGPGTINTSSTFAPLILSGQISGAGTLTVTGNNGTVVLNNTMNDYSGGTAISNSGTVSISSNTNLGNGNLTINGAILNTTATFSYGKTITISGGAGGRIDTDDTTTLTLTGQISGTSTLTKIGLGTLVLSNILNDYSGSTFIEQGTLRVATEDPLGTGNLTFNGGTLNTSASFSSSKTVTLLGGGGTIDTDDTTTLTLTGQISGPSTLTKAGLGTLVLNNGSNNYSGDTDLTLGALSLASSNALGNGAGTLNMTSGTTLALDSSITSTNDIAIAASGTGTVDVSSGTGTLSGIISGVGATLAKTGTGTLVLNNGLNSYNNGTTLSAGTLLLGNDSALGNGVGTLDMSAGTTLALDSGISIANTITTTGTKTVDVSSGTGTLSGALSGTGTLLKTGAGDLNFTGTLTQDAVVISAGTLFVNTANFTTDLTVNSGATLGGAGTVTGDVTNNGTIAPGNSIDTIYIAGNYLQASGSQYIVELDPNSSDLISVTGTTTIESNTTLNIQLSLGNYAPNRQYFILTSAGGVTGEYQFEIAAPALFAFNTSYTANDVYLFLNVMPFNSLNLDSEAGAVAACLDSANVAQGSDLEMLIDFLYFMSIPELESTLHAMSPAQLSGLDLATQEIFVDVGNILSFQMNRFCKKSSQFKARGWAKYFGAYYDQSSVGTVPGYKIHPQGGIAGFDFSNDTGAFLGFSGGYSEGHLVWENARGSAKVENGFCSIYGGKTFESSFYIQGSITEAGHWYDTKRNILFSSDEFTPFTRTAIGETSGVLAQGEFEIGSYFDKFIKCRPFLKTGYTVLHRDSFTERGADEINLRVDNENSDLLRSEAGLELVYTRSSSKKSITPSLLVGGIYEAHFLGKQQRASFEPLNCTMAVDGIGENRWIFEVEGALTLSLFQDRFNLGGNVHYELGHDYSQLSCLGEFRFGF